MSATPSEAVGGDTGRRRFLVRVIAGIHALIGTSLGVVLGGTVLAPSLARREGRWLAAASLLDLIDDEPMPVTLRLARDDGYSQVVDRHVVFLVKSGDEVKALSSVCTHLGCRVSWHASERVLKCPCHGGVFDASGAVVGGPPPAPLAAHAARLDGDMVMVQL
ncbi:MAG: Rieske (2Fe-2S) protein [Vicinamibacterales bacterium]